MYCTKCGKELKAHMKFCEHCGTARNVETKKEPAQDVATEAAATPAVEDPKVAEENQEVVKKANDLKENSGKPDKKTKGIILGVLVVVVVAAAALLFGRKTINLNEYVTLTVTGYEGYGKAEWEFDSERFEEDYGKKVKFTKDMAKELGSWLTPCEAVEMSFTGSIDNKSGLSNGDIVTFSWDRVAEEDIKKVFKNKFKFEDISIIVDGLEEVESFDAFADIHIEYTGCEPSAEAIVINNSKDDFIQGLRYEVENGKDLSNGDKITVKVSAYNQDDLVAYCAENYGKIPETDSKEYTVDNLNVYITSIDQIPEDFLNKMKGEVEDHLRAQAASDWNEDISLEDVTYIGAYVLKKKEGASYSYNMGENVVYLVYNVGVHEDYSSEDVDNHINYYYYGSFNNVMLLADGTCSTDLAAMNECNNSFTRRLDVSNGLRSYTNLTYTGYENLDRLFNKCVTAYIDNYTYVSTVEDIEAEVVEEDVEETVEETEQEETEQETVEEIVEEETIENEELEDLEEDGEVV